MEISGGKSRTVFNCRQMSGIIFKKQTSKKVKNSKKFTSDKVVIILKAMAFFNLSTKNSNRGRELYTSHLLGHSLFSAVAWQ